jgi:outer membrane protein
LRLSLRPGVLLALAGCFPFAASPQGSTKLTLEQAQQIALKNHPRLASAVFHLQASQEVTAEARSAYFPVASANITGAAANDGTALAAGALTTSSLASRFSTGVNLVQLVTDFGRTSSLTQTARDRAAAEQENVVTVRAQILLGVREAYFRVLGTEAVRKAAQAALDSRRLLLRQVSALAKSSLKSTLDVSFAQVLVSEAELAVYQAENNAQQSRAGLAAAMGVEQARNYVLTDVPLPGEMNPDLNDLIAAALRDRPDLNVLKRQRDAAYQFAKAEKRLSYPTINLMATGGVIPERDHTLPRDNYEAIGANVNIPIFNGGLFAARRSEALLRAQAADKDVQDYSLIVSRDVQNAWFEANNAFHRLDVSRRLVDQAAISLHLAQARYNAGLGSIVELNQAQLNETSAEINAAGAKYDYLSRRTALDYALGALR